MGQPWRMVLLWVIGWMTLLHSVFPCNTIFWGYITIVSLMHKCWLPHLCASPCWTPRRVGSICAETNKIKYGHPTTPPKNSHSHKKRALEVDTSSDSEEPTLHMWPRFLIVQGTSKGLKGSDLETSLLESQRGAIPKICCVPKCWQLSNTSCPTSQYELQKGSHTM